MGTRVAALALLVALAACSGEQDPGLQPADEATSDADCARRIPDGVFTTLGWTATAEGATATVRGCHREAQQGYVEVRDRTGDYERTCRTLDRSGGVDPGVHVDWLGDDVTACAVEPAGGSGVGQTKVLVAGEGDALTLVTIAVLTSTPQAQVRAAVEQLV
jgi:hypothetical protein